MARKKKKDDEIRTDGWMDTFADTMTLILTFFILLYSISAVDSEKLKKLSEALQYSLTGDSSIEEVQSIDDLKVELEKGTKYEDLAAKLNEIIEKNSLTDEIKIREEERGIVLQVDESILFDSGKAEIKSESINVLDTIAKIIQETDNEIVAEGKAVIVISSEMPEVIGVSDRILVMHEGKMKGEINNNEAQKATQEQIMSLMTD